MDSYGDLFVASVAVVGGTLALAVSLGPWPAPYELRTVAMIRQRYGMAAARAMWMLVALASLLAGVAIATGFRPGYATPDTDSGVSNAAVDDAPQ